MPSVIAANPDVWLPVLQSQLVTKTGLPLERVNLVLRPDPPLPDLQDVFIRLGGFQVNQSSQQGSGRYNIPLRRVLYVVCRTRVALDNPETDTTFITDPAVGHWSLENKVLDALLQYQPTDNQGNVLLVDPLALMDSPDPEKKDDRGQTVLLFSATYLPVLS